MQTNSRTVVSVVSTVVMVILTVMLAAWSPPQTTTPAAPHEAGITFVRR